MGLMRLLLQGLFENLPVLHDDHEVLRRVGQQAEVSERVAVHEQQVCERAFLDADFQNKEEAVAVTAVAQESEFLAVNQDPGANPGRSGLHGRTLTRVALLERTRGNVAIGKKESSTNRRSYL